MRTMVRNTQIMNFDFTVQKKKIFHVYSIDLFFIQWDKTQKGCQLMAVVVNGLKLPILKVK